MEIFNIRENKINILLIGLGGAGCGIISRLSINLNHIKTVAIDTDKKALFLNKANEKIAIGENITRGLSAGGNPEVGEKAALNDMINIKERIVNSDILIIVVGLGGGTGSGGCDVILNIAKQLKIQTIVIYTIPFEFEGNYKKQIAEKAINNIFKNANAYLAVDNNNLIKTALINTSIFKAYSYIDEILINFITCITRMIYDKKSDNNEYFDLMLTLKNAGKLCFSYGKCLKNENLALAFNRALANNILDVSFEKATKVFISIRGDEKLEPNEKSNVIKSVESILPNKDIKIYLNHCIESEIENSYILYLITINKEGNMQEIKYKEAFDKYKETKVNKIIFLSYSHNDKLVADNIDNIISEKLKNDYYINRDERALKYKDSIKKFMETIPNCNYVLMLVSKSYLESENCMYEVLETMRNHDYENRMLFIVLEDANIYDDVSLLKYQEYWNKKYIEKENEIKINVNENKYDVINYLDEKRIMYEKIKMDIINFIKILKKGKGYKYEELLNLNFEQIINYIYKRDKNLYKIE